jgi:hypothetical protein
MVTVVLVALAAATLLDSDGALAAAQQVPYPAVRVPLVDLLRPVNAVSSVLGLHAPRNALARAVGNAPMSSSDDDPNGLAAQARKLSARPAAPSASPSPAPSPKSSPTPTAPPIPYLVDGPAGADLPNPAPGRPLRLLVTGDSMSGEPGYALSDLLTAAGRTDLEVRDEPYTGTGLVRPDAFDWSRKATAQAHGYSPDVVVVFLGENDGYALNGASPYSPAWVAPYAARIRAVMHAYQAGGAKLVIWAAPPIDAQTSPWEGSNVNVIFRNIGAATRQAVAATRGTIMVDQYGLFSVDGHFAGQITDPLAGGVVTGVRASDGSHLTRAGGTVVARLLLRYLDLDQLRRAAQAARHNQR